MPTANVAKAKKDAYVKWIASDDIAHCYMLALMSNVPRQRCQGIQTVVDIMASFQICLGRHLFVHGVMPLKLL